MSTVVPLQIPDLPRPLRLRLHGEQDRHISRRIRDEGCWEPYETSLVLAALRPGDVFVDVGANIGYFSVIASALLGTTGRVFAFEPEAGNFALLQQNLVLNSCQHNVTAVPAALACKAGAGRLFLSEDNAGDHQLYASGGERRQQAVSLLNGSDYLRGRLTKLDMLKVDVQGAEYAVMSGLLPLLHELPRPPRIILELTPFSLRQAGSSGRALVELLATLDQPLFVVDHIQHRLETCPAAELARWCDHVDAVPADEGFINILVGEPP